MPNIIDDSKEAQDERYNPSDTARDLYARENDASQDTTDNHDKIADDSPENANIASARAGEQDAAGVANRINFTGSSKKDTASQKPKFFSKQFWTKGNLRKKGPIGLIISLFLLGGIGGSIVLLPGIGIVHFKETLMNNLDTQVSAIDARGIHVMASKVQGGASICTNVISIRCKFSSLSDRRIAKLQKNGFTVDKGKSPIPGRSTITNMSFTDRAGKVHTIKNPGELRNLLASSSDARSSYRTSFNSRFENFSGKAFSSVMRKIPGVNKTQKIPDTPDKAKVNEAIKSASKGRPINAGNGVPGAVEGEEDPNKSNRDKTNKDLGKLNEEANKVSESGVKSTTGALKGAIRGVGVLGALDSACVAKNTMSAIETGAKVLRASQLVNFAMVFLTAADAIKAGDITPNQAEAAGDILTATDERQTITITDSDGKQVEQKNPYYKKSAFDSLGYKMAAYGDTPTHNFTSLQYLVGGTPAIGVLSGLNSAISNGVSDGTCTVVQNPFTRITSGAIGIILGVVSGGGWLAISIGGSLAISAVIPYLESILIDMIAGVAIDESTVGPEAGDAAVAGTGYMLGLMAQANGMQPNNGSAASVAYSKQNQSAIQEDASYQTQLAAANPWDIYNPYSILGKLSGALYPVAVTASTTGSSFISSVAALPTVALQSLLPSATVSAADNAAGCIDPSYEKIGIKAGGMCQVGFYMTSSELAMDPMKNVEWMIESGNIDAEDGTPKGEYEKFMQNCVERMEDDTMVPFGSKGEKVTDGSECLDQSKNVMKNISHFRVYTMDKNLSDSIDFETTDELAAQEVPRSDVITSSGEWSSPAPAYTRTQRGFGYPVSYDSHVRINGGFGHNGVDLSGTRKAEDLFAACDGVLTHTKAPSYNAVERTDANTIVVDCGGNITVGYHHATLDAGLSNGTTVKAGQKIGRSDLSGNTTGYHVHFTTRVDGKFVDPVPFFKDKGIALLK